jgi:quercetin dioxygenase-like cupin family protein
MFNSRRKLLLALFVVALCGLSASLHLSRAVAQQKPQAQASNAAEAPEVATRFSEVLRARNAKGSAVPLKVEIKEWNVTRADRAAEISDQGFYIVHLLSGEVTTEIAGKTTARNTGDFWTVEKGQHMAISLQRPQEQARLQTIAVSPGH